MVDGGVGILCVKIGVNIRGGRVINDNGFVIAGNAGHFMVK
jgi:hypothetical protein